MKTLHLLLILLLSFIPGTGSQAAAADSTSFNPRTVQVKAVSQGGVPIGAVIEWPHQNLPAERDRAGNPKWLECNGQAINAAVYPELAAIVGATVPDHRGLFKRGYGGKSAAIGTTQDSSLPDHTHRAGVTYSGLGYTNGCCAYNPVWGPAPPGAPGGAYTDPPVLLDDAGENRPVNTAVRYLMRALR
jgi:hypothetical protein